MCEIYVSCLLLVHFFAQVDIMHVKAALLPDKKPLFIDSKFREEFNKLHDDSFTIVNEENLTKIDTNMIRIENKLLKEIINVTRTHEKGYLCKIYLGRIPDYCDRADFNKTECISEKWRQIESKFRDFKHKIIEFDGFVRDKNTREQYETLKSSLETAKNNVNDFCIQESMHLLNQLFGKLTVEINRCINNHETVSAKRVTSPEFVDWLIQG